MLALSPAFGEKHSVAERYSCVKDTTFILILLEDSYIRSIKRNLSLVQTGLAAGSHSAYTPALIQRALEEGPGEPGVSVHSCFLLCTAWPSLRNFTLDL